MSKAAEFDVRLRQRRELMYRCYREGLVYEAHAELAALLSDVASEFGPQHAHDMAWRQITEQISRGWHRIALRTIALVNNHYHEGVHREDIQLQKALCLIEVDKLNDAAIDLEMLANIAKEKEIRGRALRKLALVQMMNRDTDQALATLDLLERDFAGTTHAEYAQMRHAFVLGMAKRHEEAIKRYEEFLSKYPGSPYGRLVLRHLAGLRATETATVGRQNSK